MRNFQKTISRMAEAPRVGDAAAELSVGKRTDQVIVRIARRSVAGLLLASFAAIGRFRCAAAQQTYAGASRLRRSRLNRAASIRFRAERGNLSWRSDPEKVSMAMLAAPFPP